MGVTGANFLIAETGSVALVTNEGNEGMCTILPPKVHVVLTGIEKVLPTLEDVATVMRLLPRSATGQPISNYFSLLTGPRRAGETDGPEHMYYVLVDAGRTGLLGSEFQEMLRCIRCGACMNHCPVYQKIGGHAYGWVYPGPMGSVLTPSYVGIENALDLPHAATLCGQCSVVCPVKIPLPDLLRKLREKQWERGLRPWYEHVAIGGWAFVAKRPALYALGSRIAVRLLNFLGGRDRLIRQLPIGAAGWTMSRDFPAPSGRTFRDMYRERRAGGTRTP
jgi:L-lactate dehydrogenase complex protein LldF